MAKTATYRFSRPVIRLFLLSSAACTVAKLYPFRDRGGPTTKDVVEVAILAICCKLSIALLDGVLSSIPSGSSDCALHCSTVRAMRRVVAAPINRRLWLKHWVMHVVVVAVAGLCLHGSYLLWTAAKMGLSLGVADIVCMLSCAYFSSVFGVSLWHLLPSMIWASNINPSVLVTTTVFALSYLTARVLTFEPDSKDPLPHRSETATDDQANTAIAREYSSVPEFHISYAACMQACLGTRRHNMCCMLTWFWLHCMVAMTHLTCTLHSSHFETGTIASCCCDKVLNVAVGPQQMQGVHGALLAGRNESARRAAAAWSELCSSLTQLPVLMFDCAVVCLRVLLHVFLLAFRRQAGTCRMHIPFICL